MTRHRVLIDIEFNVEDDDFKSAQLGDDATGVSDVSEAGVREAVNLEVVTADWRGRGLVPLRSIIRSRELSREGDYPSVFLPSDAGMGAA